MAILAVSCLVANGAAFELFVCEIAVVRRYVVRVRIGSSAVTGVAVRFRVAAFASNFIRASLRAVLHPEVGLLVVCGFGFLMAVVAELLIVTERALSGFSGGVLAVSFQISFRMRNQRMARLALLSFDVVTGVAKFHVACGVRFVVFDIVLGRMGSRRFLRVAFVAEVALVALGALGRILSKNRSVVLQHFLRVRQRVSVATLAERRKFHVSMAGDARSLFLLRLLRVVRSPIRSFVVFEFL